jgi:phosphatidylcholine synthase
MKKATGIQTHSPAHPVQQASALKTKSARLKAACVHMLTATGALFGLLALLAAARQQPEECFLWLGAALIVDGIDGPLARRFQVKAVLPRFSGEDLDNVIDYLTYVMVPAFLAAQSSLLTWPLGPVAGAVMAVVSLYHFADTSSKTSDGYFVGFPAIWNLVVLYFFVIPMPQWLMATIVCLCAVLTFTSTRWLHPVRVVHLRAYTFTVMALWAVAAIHATLTGFPGDSWVQVVFAASAAYGLAVGLTAKPAAK